MTLGYGVVRRRGPAFC